jgi:hypothetical protein
LRSTWEVAEARRIGEQSKTKCHNRVIVVAFALTCHSHHRTPGRRLSNRSGLQKGKIRILGSFFAAGGGEGTHPPMCLDLFGLTTLRISNKTHAVEARV